MPGEALWGLVLVLGLILLSGFFSSAEAAFLSLERLRLAHLVSIDAPGARRVSDMVNEPARLLSTILLGNNLVNVALTALITVIAVDLLGQGRGVLAATVAATGMLLILGEIVPKTLAVRFAQPVAFLYARPIKAFELVCWPIIASLLWVTRLFADRFGLGAQGSTSITTAELRTMLDIGEAEGTFAPDEVEMLERAIRFGRRQAREVMTPRPAIKSISPQATLGEFLSVYATCGHTRLPVQDDRGDLIGLVSAKDVLAMISSTEMDPTLSLSKLMRDVMFVPETKPLAALFNEMRQAGAQMAVVLDEYGAVAGLLTLKQLAEEVVGTVGEEGIAAEVEFVHVDQNTFRIEGGMNVQEANDSMELDLPNGPYDTVAGFALEILGHLPAESESFTVGSLHFSVERMDGHKIETLLVTRLQPEDARPEPPLP